LITLSTAIVAPISNYLQLAQNGYAIDLNCNKIVEIDRYSDSQFIPNYEIRPFESIQFYEQAKNSNCLSVQYIDTLERETSYGSAINRHQISIISSSNNYSDSINNRDYALNIIEYGLINNELLFSGYSWAGSYSVLSRTGQRLIDKYGVYVCRSNILITLGKLDANC
jgi:hypothetical protein